MAHNRLFRTYRVRENPSSNCEIWKAVRATSAAPTFFAHISIGPPEQAEERFIDGGLRCNNPAQEMLDEARLVFGNRRRLGCLVSIGTGHPGTMAIPNPTAFQKILPTHMITALKAIATDCESTATALARRFERLDDVYFRLNVTHGAGQISLEEWDRMGEVQTHTRAYLQEPSVRRQVEAVVALLRRTHQQTAATLVGKPSLADICMYR